MNRKIRLLGLLCIATLSLTSCGVGALPHDERYQNIDKVLTDIDYQNIGTIVHEEIDNGDGIFAPSYKKIYYKEDIAFDKIFSKLQHSPNDVNETCSKLINFSKKVKKRMQANCIYYGNRIDLGRTEKTDKYGSITRIVIIDAMNGKG